MNKRQRVWRVIQRYWTIPTVLLFAFNVISLTLGWTTYSGLWEAVIYITNVYGLYTYASKAWKALTMKSPKPPRYWVTRDGERFAVYASIESTSAACKALIAEYPVFQWAIEIQED